MIVFAFMAVPAMASANTVVLTVHNEVSGKISSAALHREELAVQYQLNHAVHSAWGTPPVKFGSGGRPVYIVLDSKQPIVSCNCGGYHDYHDSAAPGGAKYGCPGKPCAYIGYFPSQPGFWKEVLSHEAQEMQVDPFTSRFDTQYFSLAQQQLGGDGNVQWFVEVSDPVELDNAYRGLYGSTLEDSITPAWYVQNSTGPWDIRHNQTAALNLSYPDGLAYFYYPYTGQWYLYSYSSGSAKVAAVTPHEARMASDGHVTAPFRALVNRL